MPVQENKHIAAPQVNALRRIAVCFAQYSTCYSSFSQRLDVIWPYGIVGQCGDNMDSSPRSGHTRFAWSADQTLVRGDLRCERMADLKQCQRYGMTRSLK